MISCTHSSSRALSYQVAQQLCRLLTASSLADAEAVLGRRLERLPAVLTALAEVSGTNDYICCNLLAERQIVRKEYTHTNRYSNFERGVFLRAELFKAWPGVQVV